MMHNAIRYISLLLVFLIYSTTGILTKMASMVPILSVQYILYLMGAVAVMGIYAILWQQIIRRMPVSDAFMWKGSTLIYTLIFSYCIFGESISIHQVIGASIIVVGITLYAYSERKEVSQ